MASAIIEEIGQIWKRGLPSDPRVGSARDNSTTTSVLKSASGAGTNSASFSTLFSTFIPVAIYAAVCLIAFFILRRKLPRVYAPRTFLSSLQPHERTKELPNGWFNWLIQFWKTSDTDILNHSSLDGFLFLRFLKVLCTICVAGLVITWPILLPLHTYGGLGNKQLDKLTFGNIKNPSWFYIHALLAWIYFGYILYTVARECVYFINLRQAYLLSPYYSNRLSSRTVLFTCVPLRILDDKKLRRVFGDTVKNIWIPRETDDLDDLVAEREQTAHRLERAEIELITKANKEYRKASQNGHPDIDTKLETTPSPRDSNESPNESPNEGSKEGKVDITEGPCSPQSFTRSDGTPILKTGYGFDGPSFDVVGSVAAQWISAEERPYHRPIANYGRRVDTIRWTRRRLKELGPKIGKLRRDYRKGKGTPIPAVFIEFHTLVDAQSAYQTLAHHSANHMRPEIVGVRPEEIYWPALQFKWWERIIRRFLIQGGVAAMVIFWAIPAALIGVISNVSFLASKVFFLSWLTKLPTVILGLIEGLLPAVALSLLMSLVPKIMRACARQAGIPTESRIELFVQSSYFVFQIVQVFLITTLTSAASAALTDIIKNPLYARTLLGQNLPKASNFYISYFILQGLAMSATRMVHLGSIFRHHFFASTSGNPRIISAKYHRLRKIHWGSVYPVFTNMGVIAISYSLIAPIVLAVAAIGLGIVYLSYRYNLLYIYSCERDTRGLHYPRGLMHMLTGVYLAEICLAGLFGIKSAYGPAVLMFGLIIFTALVQFSLSDALSPLMFNLPRTLAAEEELLRAGNSLYDAENLLDKEDNGGAHVDEAQNTGYDSDFDPSDPTDAAIPHGEQTSRAIPIEGADQALNLTTNTLRSVIRKKWQSSPIPAFIDKIDFWTYWITPPRDSKPNFAITFLHPEIFQDYHILRSLIPEELSHAEYEYDEGVLRDAYAPLSMRNKSPRIWIPRDPAGVSKQEVAHSGKVVEVSDEGAWIVGDNGELSVDLESETGRWVLKDWERVKF